MCRIDEIRNTFPQLSREVYPGVKLVYFDNAATSQKPEKVLEAWRRFSSYSNGNVHRGIHRISNEATAALEQARRDVAAFINAPSEKQVVFTSGDTAALNIVASCFTKAFMAPGDEVIVSSAEHHSNIVPWQIAAAERGIVVKHLDVESNGEISLEKLSEMISAKTKIVSMAHISNVLGIINPVKEIIDLCHSKGVKVCIDGAQGIIHEKVDVQALDVDFYTFSGHKIYAANGSGVLYGKAELLAAMPPYMGGGEMIREVSFDGTTFAEAPLKFEAGTPDYPAQITFSEALQTASVLRGTDHEITRYLYDTLRADARITLYGQPSDETKKVGLFSFSVDGVSPEDIAILLDRMGVAVRTGELCAAPLLKQLGVRGLTRVSVAPYNTMEEAEYFVKCLDRVLKMLM